MAKVIKLNVDGKKEREGGRERGMKSGRASEIQREVERERGKDSDI